MASVEGGRDVRRPQWRHDRPATGARPHQAGDSSLGEFAGRRPSGPQALEGARPATRVIVLLWPVRDGPSMSFRFRPSARSSNSNTTPKKVVGQFELQVWAGERA